MQSFVHDGNDQTSDNIENVEKIDRANEIDDKIYVPKGQSSPGILQSGQLASKGILHIPQLSSFAIQRQVATPVQPTKNIYIR